MKIISIIILLSICYSSTQAFCPNPQKAIFFSFNALKNRDTLDNLFSSFKSSIYELSYKDPDNRQYKLTNITYKLLYSNHYQQQKYINSTHIRVILGTLNVLLSGNFEVMVSGDVVSRGIAFGRSFCDSSWFQKMIMIKGTFIQWQLTLINKISLSGLFTLESTSPNIPQSDRFILQQLLNCFLTTQKISTSIQSQINTQYTTQLKTFLNQQIIINNIDINYSYNNVTSLVKQRLNHMGIVQDQGLIGYFDIDIENQKVSINCSVDMPKRFDQGEFGGIQEIFSWNFVKFMVGNAIKQGLFTVQMDSTWQASQFQFYGGDLGNAVTYAQRLQAQQKLLVNCFSFDQQKIFVAPFDTNRIYIEVSQRCLIKIRGQQRVKLQMKLLILVKLIAENDTLQVIFDKLEARSLKFTSIDSSYVIDRQQNAKVYVQKVLNSRLNKRTFGSGLPLMSRKYAAVLLKGDYLIIFDASELLS